MGEARGVYRPGAGSVTEAGTGRGDSAREPEAVCERGQRGGRGRGERTQVGARGQLPASPEGEAWRAEGWRRGLKPAALSSYPGERSAGPSTLARGCPHRLSVAFTLLLIHIYLFIDFYEVSLPSSPSCLCCSDHPHPTPSHPAVCAAVCLSVTRKIKTASSRTYVCGLWGGMTGGYSAYTMPGYWDGAFQPFLDQ